MGSRRRVVFTVALSMAALLCASMLAPAFGAPKAVSAASLAKRLATTLKIAKRADRNAKRALKAVQTPSGNGQPGPAGPKGDTGAAGAKGDTGPAGPKGATGATGETGETGSQGEQGPAGPSHGYASRAPSVAFFGSDQALATLDLPAGSYILTGFANADNDLSSQQTASCRIAIGEGNTTVVQTGEVNLGPQPGIDHAILSVTGGATQASAGRASLRCTASSNLGAWVVSGLTAVKVAELN